MEKLVPLIDLLVKHPNYSVRKVDYTPEASRVMFDWHQTGCSISEKDEQTAATEITHEWYPFTLIDNSRKNVLCIVPDAVPKFKLCLEGWAGFFYQFSIIAQFSTELYGNKALKAIGIPLSPAIIRAMRRVNLLELINCNNRVWVGTYAKPNMGSRMLKLQCMEKLTASEVKKVPMYDLDKGRTHLHEASILPIIMLQRNTMVDPTAFYEGGKPLKMVLPED